MAVLLLFASVIYHFLGRHKQQINISCFTEKEREGGREGGRGESALTIWNVRLVKRPVMSADAEHLFVLRLPEVSLLYHHDALKGGLYVERSPSSQRWDA